MITLTTDFGLSDHYAGVLKGVILGIASQAIVVDISHEVTQYNIAEAGYLLLCSFQYFPRNAIHVAVVDPGVGTERPAIAVESPHGLFVGPDNGIFCQVLTRQGVLEHETGELTGAKAVVLENEQYRLHPVSQTFHGRDIFAPAAAYLARGLSITDLGPTLPVLRTVTLALPTAVGGMLRGSIVHVDRFGNAISNVTADLAPPKPIIEVGGRSISGLGQNYQEGQIMAIAGSSGFLEIAARDDRAVDLLHLKVGDPILIRSGEP